MVEIELSAMEFFTAVLARVFIPRKNIIPAEAHLFFRESIVNLQKNDPGYFHGFSDHADGFVVLFDRELSPTLEIEGLVFLIDGFCHAEVNHAKRSLDRRHLDRHEGAVKN